MGTCCYYKPPSHLVQAHLNAESSQNDSLFYQLPTKYSQPPIEDPNAFHSLSRLKSEYTHLGNMKKEYVGKLKDIGVTQPFLLIEVQKGRDLYIRNCLRKGVRLVSIVQLLPNGQSAVTHDSDLVIPFWYSAFTLIVGDAKLVRITVALTSKCTAPVEVGSCEFGLEPLKDQRVVTGWFPIVYQVPEGDPAISLRVQFIDDEKKLLQRLVDETTLRLTDLKSKLDQYEGADSVH